MHLAVYNYYEDNHYANLPNYDQFQFTVYTYTKISIISAIESQTGKKDFDYQYNNGSTNPIGRIKRASPFTSSLYSFAIPEIGEWDGWETSFNRIIEITQPGVYVFETHTPPKDVTAEWTLKIENVRMAIKITKIVSLFLFEGLTLFILYHLSKTVMLQLDIGK